jgi:leader peptidase (prepilin peptidase) / N-methyltransferase
MDNLIVAIASVFVFAFGASIGSFLNVVVYRLPAGLSLIHPPSRCPHCLHQLGATENIPVFGWLWLKGKCRWCRSPVSWRYPTVEAITGLLFLLVFWQFGFNLVTVGYWALLSWLLSLSLIDLDTMTLPNSLTKSALIAGLVFQIIQGWQTNGWQGISNHLMFGISGAVLGIWLLWSIRILGTIAFQQPAMGDADEKLMAAIGAWLGWKCVLLTGLFACFTGVVIGVGAIALSLVDRKQPIPFGPFLSLGAVLTIFWGQEILSTYLQLMFPSY